MSCDPNKNGNTECYDLLLNIISNSIIQFTWQLGGQ